MGKGAPELGYTVLCVPKKHTWWALGLGYTFHAHTPIAYLFRHKKNHEGVVVERKYECRLITRSVRGERRYRRVIALVTDDAFRRAKFAPIHVCRATTPLLHFRFRQRLQSLKSDWAYFFHYAYHRPWTEWLL